MRCPPGFTRRVLPTAFKSRLRVPKRLFSKKRPARTGGAILALFLCSASALADPVADPSFSRYGVPGLIDMPAASMAPDADLSVTASNAAEATNVTLSFQITPRLFATYRYSIPASGRGFAGQSADLRYQLLRETGMRPAVTIGLQDFIGTGTSAAEYVVATKHVGRRLAVTTGLGWGSLASRNSFRNPLAGLSEGFEQRPVRDTGLGGEVEYDQWFHGPAAVFGGLSYQLTPRWTLQAEYSTASYDVEVREGTLNRASPVNIGVNYALNENVNLHASLLQGDRVGFAFRINQNPRIPAVNGGLATAPPPVQVRPARSATALGWQNDPATFEQVRQDTATLLAGTQIELLTLSLDDDTATVRIANGYYGSEVQAVGRTARILTASLPAHIERFEIIPVDDGIDLSGIVLSRADLERLEFAPRNTETLLARTTFRDASLSAPGRPPVADPRFRWGLGPYIKGSYFDPADPVRLDFGAHLDVSYQITPVFSLSGSVLSRLAGNRDEAKRDDPSTLPRVRTDVFRYAKEDTVLERLTADYYFRPGKNLYGRLSAGYLEEMYGGVSGELLWKPVDSRLALGAELSAVKKRSFDQRFGFKSYETLTGHLSAYYDFDGGFHTRVDAGRYLAGDWGTTISLARRFANGWSVGAYATFTDVSFEDYGEGSFTKGVSISIPLEHLAGQPTRLVQNNVIQPIVRDGGARINVSGRLYGKVRPYHATEMAKSWGRFWR